MPLYINFNINRNVGFRITFQGFGLKLNKRNIEYEKGAYFNADETEHTSLETDFLGLSEPSIGFYWSL